MRRALLFGVSMLAAVSLPAAAACGGTVVDATRSGGASDAGGGAGTHASGGTFASDASTSAGGIGSGGGSVCSSDADCTFESICFYCADGGRRCPNGARCVGGECVVTFARECAYDTGGAAGFTGSSGSAGSNGGADGTGGASPSQITMEFDVAGSGSYCQHGCVPPALSIVDSAGHSLDLGTACGVDCTTCKPQICPVIPCLPDASITTTMRVWDGTYYTNSTCGAVTPCVDAVTAPPGTYSATLCFTPGFMSNSTPPQCVVTGSEVCGSISFKFPSFDYLKVTVGM